ncbi:hypothetical protein [Winogradskyella sp. SYSU M77433]|uniref:hypothetical protein n=1 Tax=Winogradskyella sp. SYSU M77433 TaxID=3042722 RepID=UPI0024804C25|nr:hypothetical protein [Winogradskyella sp. SYSU M77433]MDH7913745.1 hypothetical protein [Winogradskyella sp. SYSU M77433]
MHWPYGNILVLYPIVGILVMYSLRFILKDKKVRLDYLKLFLVITWCINYISSGLHLFYLPEFTSYIPLVLFAWWFIEEGITYFTSKSIKGGKISKVIYYTFVSIIVIFILLGLLLRIHHWPYGSLILTLGMLMASFFVVIDYFLRENKKPSTKVEGFSRGV